MNLKQELYNQCLTFIDKRFQIIKQTIKETQESLQSETKSSAGDKHETGRAMLHLEREKTGKQLAEIQKEKASFSKIDITKTSKNIGLGSLVLTTQSNYFMAISAGKICYNNNTYYAISPNTPIGKLLMGKTINATIKFRDNVFKITKIL